jgi:hypothetical protein
MTIAAVVTALVSCGATNLHAGTSRVPIAADDIVAAVRAKGVPVQPAQISFLAAVTASQTAPRLHITGSRKLGNAETAVRFACDTNTLCLPFFVILSGLDDKQEALLSQVAGIKPKSTARTEKPCMHNGDRASLVIEGRNMRITLPVIALQNGRVGETIRVTDTERKKVYRAEVSGPGLLKSVL